MSSPHAAARITSCGNNLKSTQYPINLFLQHNKLHNCKQILFSFYLLICHTMQSRAAAWATFYSFVEGHIRVDGVLADTFISFRCTKVDFVIGIKYPFNQRKHLLF